MKANEIREKSTEEIQKLLEEKKQAKFNFKLQKSMGQIEDFSSVGETKRDIARIKTILTERKKEEKRGEV
ncbi:MAG: 50S ribosomal protein L29 [bacterium]